MKSILLILLGSISLTSPLSSQDKKKPEVNLVAEVIDTKCFVSGSMGNATGEEHKGCAIMCAKAGVPLGFLEEKTRTVYFAARLKGMAGANEILLPFVGERVIVTGRIVERGGAKMFMVDTVEKAP